MKDASMSLGIYFEIKDAELYGGEGTTGYAATIVGISIEGLQNADFEKYADRQLEAMASMAKVPKEKVRIISKDEYEENTEEEYEATMTYDEIIEQLEITKSKIKEIARNEYGGESWNDDLDALTEAADIVADYSKATAQASEMSQKYEQPAMAVRRAAGLYTCPLCGKRTQVGHTHCHWCGKKLSWDREAYADRDYPHMSTKGGERRGL